MSVILCGEPAASNVKLTHIFIFIDNKKQKSEVIEPGNKLLV